MANKNAKSFITDVKSGGRGVVTKATHFVPGYSPGHKATESEAKEYYISARKADIVELERKIALVQAELDAETP